MAATSPTTFSQVVPGQTATTTWSVTVPAGAAPGTGQLEANADFNDANGQGSVSAPAQVSVPFPSLPDAFSNPGISDDSNTSAGNLDGGGASYSAQALAAAGLTPGATITHDGVTLTWPNAPAGANPDFPQHTSGRLARSGEDYSGTAR